MMLWWDQTSGMNVIISRSLCDEETKQARWMCNISRSFSLDQTKHKHVKWVIYLVLKDFTKRNKCDKMLGCCWASLQKHPFLLARDVSRETSPAAESEEKRMFSQAIAERDKISGDLTVNHCTMGLFVLDGVWPSFLYNLLMANQRRDDVPKTVP